MPHVVRLVLGEEGSFFESPSKTTSTVLFVDLGL
jgi:hypothetical protein